jgi:hypothetical protein
MWPFSMIKHLSGRLNNEIRERDQDALRHIENLQAIAGKQEAERRALQNQVEYLVRTIREMDEQIFKMSQCTSWDQMRPNFVQLQEGMTVRKRAESDRINDLLRPELIKTYAPNLLGDK